MQITVFMAILIARRIAPVKGQPTCKQRWASTQHRGHGFVTIWLDRIIGREP
ncbi:hypothetical protein SS05631_c08420 [Sinorhizobium sp. CCBAU 05631]|nr:hypothetical protein SS05631_c08420 [Sinorhizobium sp. CCBAU 05631]